ncbi:MAG: type I phosphomannose isomerase catalytic subunit [Candidatus Velthaea sp.]|jgi:mannose-6-phosphate isomerase
MSTDIYPWQLEPKLSPAIWGGDELVREYGKRGDPAAKLGESWECWDANALTNGPLKGTTIAELRARIRAPFLGDLDPLRIFPVLTKIITAHDWLSAQVHPDDAYAQRVEHQPTGKTECWYVIAAKPGAQIVLGWKRDTSRAEYERRVADGTLAEILRKIPVRTGETVYVPAGLVHAIGPGVTIFETQQASDLTYRLFDWNRVGLDGEPRELHVAKAGDVLNYRAARESTLAQLAYHADGLDRTALIADPRFTVERIVATGVAATIPTQERPLILLSLEHPMEVACAGTAVALAPYQTVLIPAGAGSCSVRSTTSNAPFLFVTPPESPDELPARLRAAGVSQPKINGFTMQFEGLQLAAR